MAKSYVLRNFSEILSWYAARFKSRLFDSDESAGLTNGTPFTPERWPHETVNPKTYLTEITYTYNPGWVYADSILNAFQTTAEQIKHSLQTLFINHDDDERMWHKDLNFSLLNAYATASQTYKWYDKSTEEFIEKPEFWFTRGCWYDMLPMCTKGKYLLAFRGSINKVLDYVAQCRRKFYSHRYTYTSYETDTDGNYTSPTSTTLTYPGSADKESFVCDFWNGGQLSWLEKKVEPLLKPIWDMGIKTKLPMQNSKSADLVYITQLVSDISASTSAVGTSKITTSKSLSQACGTYDAKKAKVTLSC